MIQFANKPTWFINRLKGSIGVSSIIDKNSKLIYMSSVILLMIFSEKNESSVKHKKCQIP